MTGSPKRLHVDRDLCEAHALCVEIAPEIFTLADDDVAVCDESPPEALWPKARSAVSACPRQAVSFLEDPPATSPRSPERPVIP
ncbi:ferredoxin [Rhodococcus sp. NPDC003322]